MAQTENVASVVAASLDAGRLHAPAIIAELGWEPGQALEADVSIPGRVRLRATWADGPVIGSTKAHLDGSGRISVTLGLRAHLGIEPSDVVVAWVERQPGAPADIVSIVPAGALTAAFGALAEQHRASSAPGLGASAEVASASIASALGD
jgi:hypothetical protein